MGAGAAGLGTDMIYDFDNTLGQLSTITSMINNGAFGSIIFTPGGGNYSFTTL